MGNIDGKATLDKDINALVSAIADTMPFSQLTAAGAVHRRIKLYELIAKYTADIKEELLVKNRELSRKLYIAENAMENAKSGE